MFPAEAEAWRRQRRMLAPVFTPASVKPLLPHFHAEATGLTARLRDITGDSSIAGAALTGIVRHRQSKESPRREGSSSWINATTTGSCTHRRPRNWYTFADIGLIEIGDGRPSPANVR